MPMKKMNERLLEFIQNILITYVRIEIKILAWVKRCLLNRYVLNDVRYYLLQSKGNFLQSVSNEK